ncbi:MAG TPA: TadE/TadG family type IV pilus assembly protein [Ktedonobacterales bacterium]
MTDARLRRRRRRISRGQALVELGLFFLLLVTMVLGSTDIATLLDDHLNIVYAARAGARVGAVMGANQYADCATIGAIQAALASNHNIQLNGIIIYLPGTNGLPSGPEESYPGNTVCTSTSPSSGVLSNPPTVNTWPASSRNTTPFTESSIGIELDYTYTFAFEPLGAGTFTASDFAVMPLEVVINQSSSPTPTP